MTSHLGSALTLPVDQYVELCIVSLIEVTSTATFEVSHVALEDSLAAAGKLVVLVNNIAK